ncbi:G-type lectin S-receptor-like serine/threonine-protein kinase At5g35370 [Panicum virgatum]|uniref:Receptor-like serine/threonine-protein kinase n=1 Tax=Panicum virgatum TaxID=38727 RepID=A0A8T0UKE8_PANVG|nr:G-type lectin S-receptor-like serine/threonine-protein kinase At5g35370 [Panicum virgatum]KAG2622485.1 hypothetical protein PVAP13_3NG263600 [Panicum virgatum]
MRARARAPLPWAMAQAPPLLHHLLLLLLSLAAPASARLVPVQYLYPPFNLTYFHFIDTNGVFLLSPAAIYNAGATEASDSQSRFFFSVLHTASRTPVWTATAAGSTILESVVLSLSATGLTLLDPSSATATAPAAWSTPRLRAPVAALRLLDTGELTLIDARNATLWSSFDRPTDTLLHAQPLRLGEPLRSSASANDLSPGAYRLVLTPNDALLQWAASSSPSSSPAFLTYWALSSDPAAIQDSSHAVASMAVNASGIYLLADNGRDTVYRLLFPSPPASKGDSRVLKVDPSGRLRALTLTAGAAVPTVWAAPANDCDLPLPCPSLSLCTPGGNGSTCMCPDALSTYSSGGCAPADGAALPASCAKKAAARYSYVSLGAGIGYLPTKFALPDTSGDALPACRDLCSGNCSCLGFFYSNSSRSCFLLHNQIGSIFRASADAAVGFIKTLPSQHGKGSSSSSLSLITIVFGIVLPTVAVVLISLLLYAMGAQWLRRKRRPQHLHLNKKTSGSWFKLPAMLSASSRAASASAGGEDLDEEDVLIPGLPTRFTYGELDAATDGFQWQIGCGGFGSVFRGELPDRSTVAVKRMNGLGTQGQGRREFLTEIAVIGNVHHVNLVKLRGFCAEGARQLLVYEYMNRGSLDQTLFRAGAGALEWPARLRVCVGTARGLAYLHGGCDRKILHCDVKPENILLDDRGGVKIADFGLAKLMSPEQSGLFTMMRGTRGYLAPEWLMNAPITDKADVYSFGMVLLEIVRGRKNSSNSKKQQQQEEEESSPEHHQWQYFPALALELHEQGRYGELVDPRLEGRADVAQVARVVRVALCCLHEDAAKRPPMAVVSAMLDGSMDAGEPRPELLRYLRMYGRGLVDLRPAAAGWMDQGKTKGSHTTAGVSSSWSPPSCVSAQQLSGPR